MKLLFTRTNCKPNFSVIRELCSSILPPGELASDVLDDGVIMSTEMDSTKNELRDHYRPLCIASTIKCIFTFGSDQICGL